MERLIHVLTPLQLAYFMGMIECGRSYNILTSAAQRNYRFFFFFIILIFSVWKSMHRICMTFFEKICLGCSNIAACCNGLLTFQENTITLNFQNRKANIRQSQQSSYILYKNLYNTSCKLL